jgi:hypothetical protein
MVSDGDAKAFEAIRKMKPYGAIDITKEECVNHVSKRLGTALRKKVEELKRNGVKIGGQGAGKLTEKKIIRLQLYYGRAMRASKGLTVDEARANIQATLMHCCATDDVASHLKCPPGEASWCFWKKAQAKGEKPAPHKKMIGTPLDTEIAKKIFVVYMRLTEKNLLERCLKGLTQNSNESLHSCIWCQLPKVRFFSMYRFNHGAAQAVLIFNQGLSAVTQQLDMLGWGQGELSRSIQQRKDKKRVEASVYVKATNALTRRAKRQAARAELDRRASMQPQLYGAGIAN